MLVVPTFVSPDRHNDLVKALVTGGAGFIGSNLSRTLLERGHEVVVLDNFLSGHRRNLDGLDLQLIEGDVRDADLVERASQGCEAIFHLAASVGNKRSIDHPVDDSEVNVIGTLRVLEAARKNDVRKVVFSSSAGTFGELKTLPISEDHPCEPDSPYGASKLCAEKQCLAYAKLYPLECVALRYFNVFGPLQRFDAYGNVIPIFVFKLLQGETITIFGDGEQTRDFVNVNDVVDVNIAAALDRGHSGAYNIGSGTRMTINQLVADIFAAAGQKTEVVYGSTRAGDVRDSLADISKAQADFGFAPSRDFQKDLEVYVNWAKSEVARV